MNFNTASCNSNLGNLGKGECDQIIGTPELLFLTLDSFEFATKAATTQAAMQAGIQAKTVKPLLLVHGMTSSDTDDSIYTSPNGVITIPTAKGTWVKEFMFQVPAYLAAAIYSYNGFSGRVIMADSYGNLIGTTPDGTKFKGLSVRNVRVGKPMLPESKEGIMTISMTMEFDNIDEYTSELAVYQVDWADNLNGLQNVTYTVVSSAATSVVVLVVRDSDGSGVTGLVATDFYIETDAGVDQAISLSAPSATIAGQYTLTVATLSAGDYVTDLNTPATMTTSGYESTASATFTI